MSNDARYCFLVEFYDTSAALTRHYHLFFYQADKTLEMYDIKNRRTFLKRCDYPSVTLKDLFIGATVSVYARQLHIIDYGDDFTRKTFSVKRGRAVVVILPDAYDAAGKIMDSLSKHGCILGNVKMVRLTQEQAEAFYARDVSAADYASKVRAIKSNAIVAVEVVSEDCVNKLQQISSSFKGAVYVPASDEDAAQDSQFFFGGKNKFQTTAKLQNVTCCIIKPHVVSAGLAGAVVDSILHQGFHVTALESFSLNRQAAEEFLEVYRGVVPEYFGMVEQLTSGPCIALEISGDDIVNKFREFAGPSDPEIAKHIRRSSLRAQYGVDKLANAVHCTDLPEDGVLEAEYFFSILQQK